MDGIITGFLLLSDIIARLEGDPALTPTRRRDLISAVLRISEIVGVDPRVTPASLQYMRPLINKVRPAKHNLRPKTWSNLRANFRAALVHALPRPPRRSDPAWERLRTRLPNPRMRKGLSRFIGFCEREEIPPAAVCDAILLQFLAYLENEAQVTNPRDRLRRTCRLWNAAADTVPGWPQVRVTLPNHRKPRRTLPLSAYPASLEKELRESIAPPGGNDRFALDGHKKRLDPSTIGKIRVEVGLALSALVEAGWDPASIKSLGGLFEPEAFETILRRYCNGDKEQTPRPTAHNLASTLIALAKRSLGTGPAALDQIAELQRLRQCLGPQSKRMTEKNRRFIREVSDPAILAKLLLLPERLANWAARTTPIRGALAMEYAVAIAILLVAPMRIANLAALRLDQHLVRPGGPQSFWLIDIPPEEVKNKVPLLHELSQRVTTVVNRHIRDFRPLRAEPGNHYLFPVGSMHKSPPVLSQQIRHVIANWVGIDMTPHQFRHLAGFLMQKNKPGSFAALAQLLGHKRIETVIRYYAELDTLSAGRDFDAILETEIAKARLPRRRQS
jgi:integrase